MSAAKNNDQQKPVVGFCVIAYNAANYIQDCMESITNLKLVTPVITIFNNGSTDKTKDILSDAEKLMQEKHLKHQISHSEKNLGTTVSRNKCIDFIMEQNADYICILDADAIINDAAISTLITSLKNDKTIGLVGPSMQNKAGVAQKTARKLPTVTGKLFKAIPIKNLQHKGEQKEDYNFSKTQKVHNSEYLLSACWLMPKSTIDLVGNFDEKIFYAPEDVDYCVRVWRKGLRCCFVPDATIIHEYQRISKKKFFSLINLLHIKGLMYYFMKYGYISNPHKVINGDKK